MRQMFRSPVCAVTLGVALSVSGVAQAGDPAAADALFREALDLKDKGDWAAACPKFKASFDLDASVGTQINLALCSEHDGRLAMALGQLAQAATLNLSTPAGPRRSQLEEYIKRLSDELAPRVPRVRLVVRGTDHTTVTLTRDGQPLPTSALGESLPTDPGDHIVGVSAPGFVAVEKRFTALEGTASEVVVELEPIVTVPPPAEPPNDKPPTPDSAPKRPPSELRDTGPDSTVIASGILMGVGGSGLVIGGILGGLAGGHAADIPESCEQDGYTCASDRDTETAREATEAGLSFQTGAIVSLSLGGAALATGLIVYLTAPGPAEVAVQPILGPGYVGVSTTW